MVLKGKESYRLEVRGGFFIVIALDESYCPVCQSVLSFRATRRRVLWKGDTDTEKDIMIIRRLYCERCKCIHHELPDCVVPFKRYSAEVIENIVTGQTTKEPPCSDCTARRLRAWWKSVKPYFLRIMQALAEKFGTRFGKPPSFREIVRAAANSKNWIFARQVCTCSESRTG
jgi:hypothetical protein